MNLCSSILKFFLPSQHTYMHTQQYRHTSPTRSASKANIQPTYIHTSAHCYIHVKIVQDLVMVPNATTGLNVAIQSAQLQPGEALYMLNIG